MFYYPLYSLLLTVSLFAGYGATNGTSLYHQRTHPPHEQSPTAMRRLSMSSPTPLPNQWRRPNKLPRPLRKSLPAGAEVDQERQALFQRWQAVTARKAHLERVSQQGLLRRCFVYPVGVLVLALITGVEVVLVVFNTLKLISGFKALPLVTSVTSTEELGDMIGKVSDVFENRWGCDNKDNNCR